MPDLPLPCQSCLLYVSRCLGGVDQCLAYFWVSENHLPPGHSLMERCCVLQGEPGVFTKNVQVRFENGDLAVGPKGSAKRTPPGRAWRKRAGRQDSQRGAASAPPRDSEGQAGGEDATGRNEMLETLEQAKP